MARKNIELGESELEVIKSLWQLGPATVREVHAQLTRQGRQLAYTTVLTFLTRLEQKGYVVSNKDGMAYVYRAKLSRQRVAKSWVSSVVDQLFDGEPGSLVLQLMQTERFEPEEIAEFRKLIERLDNGAEARLSDP